VSVRTLLVGGLVTALSLMAIPALAETPEVSKPEPVEFQFEFESGFPCEFGVGVSVSGKQGEIFFGDRAILTAPGLSVDLTNVDTGTTVSLTIPGTFHDEFLEDGLVRTKAVGRNVLFGLFDGEPGMFLTIGKIVLEWSLEDPLSFDVVEEESPGKMIDLCAMLAG
jgi:hypothetical protein